MVAYRFVNRETRTKRPHGSAVNGPHKKAEVTVAPPRGHGRTKKVHQLTKLKTLFCSMLKCTKFRASAWKGINKRMNVLYRRKMTDQAGEPN